MNTTPKDILAGVFAWGTMDIDGLCKQFDAFEVDPCDVGWELEHQDYEGNFQDILSGRGINTIHQAIFEEALNRAEFNRDRDEDKLEIYCNCISIDGEKIYSYDELKAAVDKLNNDAG